ncbi:DUF2931 family protein [Marinobacter mangrovi]|uniref:DUF2931 family protein n=1 Tax=Marinobacter mangrovi TaxID=2803918 RepID=UPI0019311E92|nr:DUF2931 family protein [Marinobacter mangrovi]
MKAKAFLIALLAACFAMEGCATQSKNPETWHVGVGAPEHYDVIVEKFKLISSEGYSQDFSAGNVGCCWKGSKGPRGKGGPASRIPRYVGVQWYSLAEGKAYKKAFPMPEDLKSQMQEEAKYITSKGEFSGPRDILTIGLAPGGTIVVWIQNQIGNEIEVARMQANEIEGDPDDYRAATKRYLEANGDYLKKHGVSTTGW